MEPEQEDRLRDLLRLHGKTWHAGRTVKLTLYKGEGGPEDYIGTMMTPYLADLVVLCHEYVREHLGKKTNA